MLVTPSINRRNQFQSIGMATAGTGVAILLAYLLSLKWVALVPVSLVAAWLWRRRTRRRMRVMQTPFPDVWDQTLLQYVTFYVALAPEGKQRFRNLVKVFLDEVAITGVRCDVDESTRALVAASAVIPIFGFDDFEYAGLGEVLIYPDAFDADYQTDPSAADRHVLGMVGVKHLSGVMILSRPSLIAGFQNDGDKRNVGIHEFAHLVDKRDGDVDGIPPTIPAETIDPWIRWIGEELRGEGQSHIDDYAYTNEAEYFAVLSEYFFERPKLLEQKSPQLYAMLQKMYHQNPKRLGLRRVKRRGRVRRNDPCPCGSGEKYKQCCRQKSMRGVPSSVAAK